MKLGSNEMKGHDNVGILKNILMRGLTGIKYKKIEAVVIFPKISH